MIEFGYILFRLPPYVCDKDQVKDFVSDMKINSWEKFDPASLIYLNEEKLWRHERNIPSGDKMNVNANLIFWKVYDDTYLIFSFIYKKWRLWYKLYIYFSHFYYKK